MERANDNGDVKKQWLDYIAKMVTLGRLEDAWEAMERLNDEMPGDEEILACREWLVDAGAGK